MLILCLTLCSYFIYKLYILSIQSAKNTISLSLDKFEKQWITQLHHSKTQYLTESDLKDSYRYGVLFNNLERVQEIFSKILHIKDRLNTYNLYQEYGLVDINQKVVLATKNPLFLNSLKKSDYKQGLHFFYSHKLQTFIIIDPIFNKDTNIVSSWIILKINPSALQKLISSFQTQLQKYGYKNSSILLYDNNSKTMLSTTINTFNFPKKVNHFESQLGYFVSSKQIKKSQVYFAIIVPEAEVHKDIYQALYTSFTISVIVFILLFVLMYLILKVLVIDRILLLTTSSQQMKQGDLNQQIPLQSNDEIGVLARSFEDMSQSIQSGIDTLESKVEQRTIQLKDQNHKLQSLMDILSHDLKNPIGAIQGLSQLLLGKDNSEHHQEILTINQTSNRVLNLVDDLVGKNAITNAKVQFNPTSVSLESLIQNTFLENQTLAHNKDIQLEIDWNNIDEDDNIEIKLDSQKVLQILNNLISNAIKFSNSNESVVISIGCQGKQLKVGVIDYGKGINDNDLNRLTSIDQRTTTLGTHQEKGTGIGLPLVEELLNLHNSKLQYESLNPGSFFYFYLEI